MYELSATDDLLNMIEAVVLSFSLSFFISYPSIANSERS